MAVALLFATGAGKPAPGDQPAAVRHKSAAASKDLGSGHNPLDPRMLDFRRMFVGSAAKVKLDKAGRFAVPALLREYASLEKDGVLLGVDDHLELWSKEGWCAFQQQQMAQYKEMAAALFASKDGAGTTEGVDRDVED